MYPRRRSTLLDTADLDIGRGKSRSTRNIHLRRTSQIRTRRRLVRRLGIPREYTHRILQTLGARRGRSRRHIQPERRVVRVRIGVVRRVGHGLGETIRSKAVSNGSDQVLVVHFKQRSGSDENR